ncbi:MAG: cobalamin-dependent protein [Planctomycetota bacterium]
MENREKVVRLLDHRELQPTIDGSNSLPLKLPSIILVNPWIHDFAAYDLWLKPLGLLYVAAHLERHGFKVQLIDCLDYGRKPKQYGCSKFHSEEITKPCHFQNIPRKYKRYGMPPEVFTRLLMGINEQADEPVLIGVTSMMTYWHQGVSETIRYIKEVFTGTPVVLGGVYATLCYKHALKKSGADHVIQGPGEEAVLNLARKLAPIDRSTGRPADRQIDYPAYYLYDNLQSVAMLTSWGCPFRCSYCSSASLSDKFTQRPAGEVLDEMEYYHKQLGVTDIAFYDDALLANPVRSGHDGNNNCFDNLNAPISGASNGASAETHIHPILDGIIRCGLNRKLRFHTPNGLHIKYIDKLLAQKLYKANFKTIRLGFEGMDEHKASPEQLAGVIAYLKEAGFTAENIGVYVLMGRPSQNLDEIDRAIEFVHHCGAQVRISQYSPVPGSADFAKLLPLYPDLETEPLLHNKSVYYCHNVGRRFDEFETLKLKAKRLNAEILR